MQALASGGDGGPAGPFPVVAPSIPFAEFAGGRLGVLDGTFQRAYLVAAWRALDGRPLSAKEAEQLQRVFRTGTEYLADESSDGASDWADALKKYAGTGDKKPFISMSRMSFKPDPAADNTLDLSSYPNCNLEATRTAARTLKERHEAHAADAKWLADWAAGQQQVFENCGDGFVMPEAAPAQAPLWFRQDRAYQRASAFFYAGRFDEATSAFEAIARDKASPWSELAPYLAARAQLRKASLTKDAPLATTRLAEARKRFEALAASGTPTQKRLADSMLRRVRAAGEPLAILADASRRIGELPWGPDAENLVGDLLTLVRPLAERRTSGDPVPAADLQAGELANWMADFGATPHIAPAGGFYGYDYAFSDMGDKRPSFAARVCKQAESSAHPKAWALACLAAAKTTNEVPAKVLAVAQAWHAGEPAYPTARYHLLRLQHQALTASAKPDVAGAGELRLQLDKSIAEGTTVWAAEGLNSLKALRARTSSSVADVLRFSRLPLVEEPPRYGWHVNVAREVKPELVLHPYAAEVLSRGMTTAVLSTASRDESVPTEARKHLRRTAWVRAALLEDTDQLAQLTPELARDYPEHEPAMSAFTKSQDGTERRFLLALLLLKDPRFSPLYDETRSGANGYDRDSGWCDLKPVAAPPAFFDERGATQAGAEAKRLVQLTDGTSFIGNALLAWSQVSPQDERLAPALANVVAATRMNGCLADKTVSKRAYQALHKLFPKSPAARATRYWF